MIRVIHHRAALEPSADCEEQALIVSASRVFVETLTQGADPSASQTLTVHRRVPACGRTAVTPVKAPAALELNAKP